MNAENIRSTLHGGELTEVPELHETPGGGEGVATPPDSPAASSPGPMSSGSEMTASPSSGQSARKARLLTGTVRVREASHTGRRTHSVQGVLSLSSHACHHTPCVSLSHTFSFSLSSYFETKVSVGWG